MVVHEALVVRSEEAQSAGSLHEDPLGRLAEHLTERGTVDNPHGGRGERSAVLEKSRGTPERREKDAEPFQGVGESGRRGVCQLRLDSLHQRVVLEGPLGRKPR